MQTRLFVEFEDAVTELEIALVETSEVATYPPTRVVYPYRFQFHTYQSQYIVPMTKPKQPFCIALTNRNILSPIAVKIIYNGINIINGEEETDESYPLLQDTDDRKRKTQNFIEVVGHHTVYGIRKDFQTVGQFNAIPIAQPTERSFIDTVWPQRGHLQIIAVPTQRRVVFQRNITRANNPKLRLEYAMKLTINMQEIFRVLPYMLNNLNYWLNQPISDFLDTKIKETRLVIAYLKKKNNLDLDAESKKLDLASLDQFTIHNTLQYATKPITKRNDFFSGGDKGKDYPLSEDINWDRIPTIEYSARRNDKSNLHSNIYPPKPPEGGLEAGDSIKVLLKEPEQQLSSYEPTQAKFVGFSFIQRTELQSRGAVINHASLFRPSPYITHHDHSLSEYLKYEKKSQEWLETRRTNAIKRQAEKYEAQQKELSLSIFNGGLFKVVGNVYNYYVPSPPPPAYTGP